MNQIYKPGTLVTALYKSFDGTKLPGIFLVLYDESLDPRHNFDCNVVGVKCTTSHAVVGNYTIALEPEEIPGLENASIAACSKLQTLDKSKIGKVICQLPSHVYTKFYKEYTDFANEVDRQMKGGL